MIVSLGAVLAAGLLLDLAVKDVPPAEPKSPPGGLFAARSVFCPPSVDGSARAAVVGEPATPVPVGIEAVELQRKELAADRLLVADAPPRVAIDLVGYGAPLFAGASLVSEDPVQGGGGARCATEASDRWYFAEGQSTLGYDGRFIIYNPFPDEAVVRITLLTNAGERSKAGLSDIAVPAGEVRKVEVNDFVLRQPVLGAEVAARRGRVVVWRSLFAKPDARPNGVQFSLGSPEPSTEWYFPDGGLGRGIEERLSLANPSDEEAVVTVSFASADEPLQPPELVEFALAPRTTRALSLPEELGRGAAGLRGLSALVRVTNSVGIVAERSVYYSTDDLSGVASEVGATETATGWMLGPALFNPHNDAVALLNPGSANVRVSIALVRAGGAPLTPDELSDVALKGGTRLKLPIGRWTRSKAMTAIVTASGPVVAERFSYSEAVGDVAALMGLPFTPSEP